MRQMVAHRQAALGPEFHSMKLPIVDEAIRRWDRFWFTPSDPIVLALVRITTGLTLLFAYAGCFGATLDYLGPDGWLDEQALMELRAPDSTGAATYGLWIQSIWFYVRQPTAIEWVQGCFLLAIVGLTLGLFTRSMNVAVLLGHLSFVHRALPFSYGFDSVATLLVLYLLIGPSGARWSIDAWLERVWSRKPYAECSVRKSWTTTLSLRAIQLHLALLYLSSGLGKLRGDRWWSGDAFWDVISISQARLIDLRWIAYLGDDAVSAISSLAVVFTIGFEVGFVLTVWNRRLRPYVLTAAVVLHVGIAVVLGLISFAAAMLAACLAFVPPAWVYKTVDRIRHVVRSQVAAPTGASSTTIEELAPRAKSPVRKSAPIRM